MGKRIAEDKQAVLTTRLQQMFGSSPAEQFLYKEMERYLPQFSSLSDDEFQDFVQYQQAVYLNGEKPILGRPLASLNPTFIDSIDSISLSHAGEEVYTRASIKENGFRMQLHRGAEETANAFTRQFTRYDLRILPELAEIIETLPVMIGDGELINKRYPHLAGFNRLHERIPDARYWPTKGEKKLNDDFVALYLQREDFFKDGKVLPEFECTLAFHGLFAIADPKTWNKSKEEQAASLISLCRLPMNYQRVDELLTALESHLREKNSAARVVERQFVPDRKTLQHYIREKEQQGLEGVCVVQHLDNTDPATAFKFAKSFKIKKYETIDTALLGLYYGKSKEDGDEERIENGKESEPVIRGALLGVFDHALGKYVPLCKVNLDPEGVQIKTKGQRQRLERLRDEVSSLARERSTTDPVTTLYDVYLAQGKTTATVLLHDETIADRVITLIQNLPRGKDLFALLSDYETNRTEYDSGARGKKKSSIKAEQCIDEYRDIFGQISALREEKNLFRRFQHYFSRVSEVKVLSKRLAQPDLLVSTENPIVLETQAFDIKWGESPFPAGFHSWYCNSLHFNNVFAERVRHDKSTTTDYETVFKLARMNTVKKKRQKK